MIDDRTISDTARSPGNETPGFARLGVRPAAKKATKKTAKKAAKKTAKKTVAKKAVKAGGAGGDGAKKKTAKKKAARAASAPSAVPDTPVPGAATGGSPTGSPPGDPAVGERASRADAPRPIVPAHAGAHLMDAAPEELGGLGGFLALWGPLIIVGFLVLVFRGGAERASAVAAGPDASAQSAAVEAAAVEAAAVEVAAAPAVDTPAQTASGSGARRAADPSTGARTPEHVSDLPGAGRMVAEAFDRGFAMRTSMAGGPAFAGRESDTPMPAGAPGRLYPPPPGPYRDPRYRGLPTDESWPAAVAGDWAAWSTGGREDTGSEDGDDARAQWVRCAPPYYWCPAPGNPAW